MELNWNIWCTSHEMHIKWKIQYFVFEHLIIDSSYPACGWLFVDLASKSWNHEYNIYFRLRFGAANAINNYLMFKIPNTHNTNFLTLLHIDWIHHKSFWVQNHLTCSRVLNAQRLFCSQKAGVKCLHTNFCILILGGF